MSIQELRDSLSPEQRKTLKVMFFIMCGFAFVSCWVWYMLYERDNWFFLVFAIAYFYFCNVISNIRTLLMWPFYRKDETDN